jgi:hypothetical protein
MVAGSCGYLIPDSRLLREYKALSASLTTNIFVGAGALATGASAGFLA